MVYVYSPKATRHSARIHDMWLRGKLPSQRIPRWILDVLKDRGFDDETFWAVLTPREREMVRDYNYVGAMQFIRKFMATK